MPQPVIDRTTFPITVPVEVRFRDLDAFRHVNHAVLVTYLEVARTHYWQRLLTSQRLDAINFIIARIEVDYAAPVELGARVQVLVRAGELRRSSFDFHYAIVDVTSAAVYAQARTVQVMYDYGRQCPTPIDDTLRQAFARVEGGKAGNAGV